MIATMQAAPELPTPTPPQARSVRRQPRPGAKTRPATKEDAIVEAAWNLFRERGYAGTSMDGIARSADVSKATLYAYFASKDELFDRVVADEGGRHTALLDRPVPPGEIGRVLMRAALDLSALILSSDTIGVTRMVVAEAANYHGLGARYFRAGPDIMAGQLAACMQSAMERGEMRPGPARLAAGQFIGLILGELHIQHMLLVGKPVPRRAREAVAAAGAETFLRAYGIASPVAARDRV